MTGHFFPTLPDGWEDPDAGYIMDSVATGCWLWTDDRPRPLSWRQARTLIATERGILDASDCAITPTCCHPYHSRDSRTPVAGGAA